MATYSHGTLQKYRQRIGTWIWRACIDRTANGKRRQLCKATGIECAPPKNGEHSSKPSGKGAKQALQILADWRAQLIAEDAVTPNATDASVGQFVERYIASRDVDPATRTSYSNIARYITLDVPIADLDSQSVETWKVQMEAGGAGAYTRNHAFNTLKYACNWGVETGMLPRNPCAPINAPRRPKQEANPLDINELPRLLDALNNLRATKPEFADLCLFALNTGMHRGELCALRWCDIDGYRNATFEGVIHVNRAIAINNGTAYIKDAPKNGHRRTIDINDNIKTILARRHEAISAVVADISQCYVFAHESSPYQFFAPSYVTKLWNMFASCNGLVGIEGRQLRFHDLRDTFATAALVSGIPVVTVSSILGHLNTQTTLSYYAHFMPSRNVDAMNRMTTVLGSC